MAVLSSFINNGRFIKAEDQASGRNCRFINQKRAKWPDLLDSGCGWPISYCPVKGVYQWHRSDICFGKPVGPAPQRQNNGGCASDGAGLPWLSRKLCPENCFGKPDGLDPSAKITERTRATARVCHGCRRPRSPLCIVRKLISGSPSGHPPAPKQRKRARGRLSQKL